MIFGPESDPRRSYGEETRRQTVLSSLDPPRIESTPPRKGMSNTAYAMHGINIPLDPEGTRARLDEMPCMDG